MLRFVTIAKFAAESGYTERAIRGKIYDGTWNQGEVWVRAPDNRILIDVAGYEAWVTSGARSAPALSPRRAAASSPPPLVLSGAGPRRSPRPLK